MIVFPSTYHLTAKTGSAANRALQYSTGIIFAAGPPRMELFDLSFAIKLAGTALVVLLATLIAERVGAFIGAMIVALPISAGPAYLFLALDHDAAFIAESARTSLGVNALVPPFLLITAAIAPKAGLLAALTAGLGAWGLGAFAILALEMSIPAVIALNVLSFAICLPLSRPLLAQKPPEALRRGMLDIVVRIAAVMTVVGTAIAVGRSLGPEVAGIAAVTPVIWTSLAVVIYARSGGLAVSAIMANGVGGMIGFALALPTVAVMAVPYGWPVALLTGLGVCIAWSVGLTLARPYIPFYRPEK